MREDSETHTHTYTTLNYTNTQNINPKILSAFGHQLFAVKKPAMKKYSSQEIFYSEISLSKNLKKIAVKKSVTVDIAAPKFFI